MAKNYWKKPAAAQELLKERITQMQGNTERDTILKRAEASEKEVYRFLNLNTSGEWTFETFIAHASIMHLLSEQEETVFNVLPSNVSDTDYSEVIKESLFYQHRKSQFLTNDFMCKFASNIHGMAVAFDGWRTETRDRKYQQPIVDENGEVTGTEILEKNEKIYDDSICKYIPLRFFFWDENANTIEDPSGLESCRDAFFVMPNQSKKALQAKYKNDPFYSNLDGIEPGLLITEDTKTDNKDDTDDKDTTQVGHYFNESLDLYIEFTPGKNGYNIIRQGPNPYNHKKLPFSIYINEKIIKTDGVSIGGYPLPLKIQNNERGIRKLGTMYTLQTQKALDNPVFYKNDLDFEEDDLKNPDWFNQIQADKKDVNGKDRYQSPFIPVNTSTDNLSSSFYEMRRSSPDASAPNFINIMKDQIVSDSLVNTSVFNPTNESATLSGIKRESFSKLVKLISRNSDDAISRRLEIQMKNIQQFMTAEDIEEVIGEEENTKMVARKIRVDNKISEDVETEIDGKKVVRKQFRPADEADDVKYTFIEINGKVFSVDYDIIVEPTELSSSEILRRNNVLELVKIIGQILSVAPQNMDGIDLTEVVKKEMSRLGYSPDKIFNGTKVNPQQGMDNPPDFGVTANAEGEPVDPTAQGNPGAIGDNLPVQDAGGLDMQMQAALNSTAPGNFENNDI